MEKAFVILREFIDDLLDRYGFDVQPEDVHKFLCRHGLALGETRRLCEGSTTWDGEDLKPLWTRP